MDIEQLDPEGWAELTELSKTPGQIVYYRGYLMDRETFRKTILSKPVGKLEREALRSLYARRGEEVDPNDIKGGGGTTQNTLEVRGYVQITKDGDRSVSWRITDSGIAWVEADQASR